MLCMIFLFISYVWYKNTPYKFEDRLDISSITPSARHPNLSNVRAKLKIINNNVAFGLISCICIYISRLALGLYDYRPCGCCEVIRLHPNPRRPPIEEGGGTRRQVADIYLARGLTQSPPAARPPTFTSAQRLDPSSTLLPPPCPTCPNVPTSHRYLGYALHFRLPCLDCCTSLTQSCLSYLSSQVSSLPYRLLVIFMVLSTFWSNFYIGTLFL